MKKILLALLIALNMLTLTPVRPAQAMCPYPVDVCAGFHRRHYVNHRPPIHLPHQHPKVLKGVNYGTR